MGGQHFHSPVDLLGSLFRQSANICDVPMRNSSKGRDRRRKSPMPRTRNAILNVASIARDGMLVVRRNDPLSPSRECIIVPRMVLNGLVTAHHIQLEHPSAHQLKHVMRRYLFALDLGRFRWLPRGDSLGSEKHASLENTLVRFKPDTKKCHNIFCQFMTTVHVL